MVSGSLRRKMPPKILPLTKAGPFGQGGKKLVVFQAANYVDV
jgi:hypothetical protein